MKKLFCTALLMVGLSAAPAAATDIAVGEFSGSSIASVGTLSFSASGGLAANGMDGVSSVRNESGAAQLAGARSELTFTELEGSTHTTPGNNGVGNNCQGNSCGSTTAGEHGIEVMQINEAFVDGYDFSKTKVRDSGSGTAGIGGGVSYRVGDATARGSYFGGGVSNW